MLNTEFLQALHEQRERTTYARIIKLTMDERPIDAIEGRITSGSINLDGQSAVRRTCQLSLVSEDVNLRDYLWALNTKFKLQIGLANYIDSSQPDIIWFDQGIYIITSFNASINTTSSTISISGKDKMCLLNGEVGGLLTSQVNFGIMEQEVSKGIWKKFKLPIKDIIREAVHTYAQEPFHNIIINDLDSVGLTLQQYNYDIPMYLLREVNGNTYTQGYINPEQEVTWVLKRGTLEEYEYPVKLSKLESQGFKFDQLTANFVGQSDNDLSQIKYNNKMYVIAKIDYGETAGYTESDLVYPTDLIGNAGESITSILDKIKTMLGDFEYFYNLDGQFVFQKKQIYIQTPWSPLVSNTDGSQYVNSLQLSDQYAHIFNDLSHFTAIQNTPDIAKLKNDYSIWGAKSNGTPIHMRYAIDKKPMLYCSIAVTDEELSKYNKKYGLSVKGQKSILYINDSEYARVQEFAKSLDDGSYYYDAATKTLQMQYSGSYEKGTETLALQNVDGEVKEVVITFEDENKEQVKVTPYHLLTLLESGIEYVPCDWREIIYRMALDYNKYNHLDDFSYRIAQANQPYGLYPQGITGYEQYYIDLQGFWRQLYDPYTWDGEFTYSDLDALNELIADAGTDEYLEAQRDWLQTYYDNTGAGPFGWARAVYEAPETLLFWFDFLDTSGTLKEFSVPAIGARPKVENDNGVKAIYYKETPNVIFGSSSGSKSGYRYFNVPNSASMFVKSSQGKSAKEAIDNILYNYSYCAESVSITTTPIYNLDVNKRIYIEKNETGIEGAYIVNKISLPLSYNGTMNISAIRAPEPLL